MTSSVPLDRLRMEPALAGEEYDLLVIGGGIVGAGVARDAALRGLKTALVEQADFAFGTSSRSSRLLHGGLRYLAQGRLLLVREASREKKVLHRIAPHLAQPLGFLFPTRVNSDWPKWQLRLGVSMYDWLCGGENLGKSQTLSTSQMQQLLPLLDPRELTGGVLYYDGFTNDSRLVLDTLRSAARHGAALGNYLKFEDARLHRGRWSCAVQNVLEGNVLTLRAKAVANAGGPWSDRIPHSRTKLRLTKGVHLVIDRERLSLPQAVVVPEGERILFAIPWGERVILGTTDTDYTGPLANPRCTSADAAYVLSAINAAFPAAALIPADIKAVWAGLRPLLAAPRGTPSDISRRHTIRESEPNWFDIAGGKLTTYRLMAEQLVDRIAPGKKSRAAALSLLEQEPAWGSGILPPALSEAAVEHYIRHEGAVNLSDILLRRSGWAYYLPDPQAAARQVAAWMQPRLDWSDEEREHQLAQPELQVSVA